MTEEMKQELKNLLEMLEDELEWYRNHPHPKYSTGHKNTRVLTTITRALCQLTTEKELE